MITVLSDNFQKSYVFCLSVKKLSNVNFCLLVRSYLLRYFKNSEIIFRSCNFDHEIACKKPPINLKLGTSESRLRHDVHYGGTFPAPTEKRIDQ
jgi:hypothetical protein